VKIEWSLDALGDLDQIQAYIEPESPSGAKRIWLRIVERVALQTHIPFAAPLHRSGPARRLIVTGTPYIVLYVVDGDVLRVEQVVHAARGES